jgi:hypothetical protein
MISAETMAVRVLTRRAVQSNTNLPQYLRRKAGIFSGKSIKKKTYFAPQVLSESLLL